MKDPSSLEHRSSARRGLAKREEIRRKRRNARADSFSLLSVFFPLAASTRLATITPWKMRANKLTGSDVEMTRQKTPARPEMRFLRDG